MVTLLKMFHGILNYVHSFIFHEKFIIQVVLICNIPYHNTCLHKGKLCFLIKEVIRGDLE